MEEISTLIFIPIKPRRFFYWANHLTNILPFKIIKKMYLTSLVLINALVAVI